jgi:hypothetical protein
MSRLVRRSLGKVGSFSEGRKVLLMKTRTVFQEALMGQSA